MKNDLNNSKVIRVNDKGVNTGSINIDNINNSTNVYNKQISYTTKEQERSKLKENCKNKRYGLMLYQDEIVRCRGLLLHNKPPKIIKSTNKEIYTVINITDINTGFYLSDHIQIDAKVVDDVISRDLNDVFLIEFAGKVYNYDESRKDAYSIDVTHENGFVRILSSRLFITEEIDCGLEDSKKMITYLLNLNRNHKLTIIDELRKSINDYTRNDLGENFLYNYIINQFMCNMNNIDLYHLKLPLEHITDDKMIDIIVLLSATIMYLSTYPTNIDYLFANVSQYVSSVQNVQNYKDSGRMFKLFIKSFQNSNFASSDAWAIVKNRCRNFNLMCEIIPYKNEIINQASMVFNTLISKFDYMFKMKN